MRIDAHQHFWIFDPVRDAWINDDMLAIRHNFMPTDLAPLLKTNALDGVIAVQADQSHQETQFLLDLSTRSEEHTSELQSRENLVCRLLLEKKKNKHASQTWTREETE